MRPWSKLWRARNGPSISDDVWLQALSQLPYCLALDSTAQARLRVLSNQFLEAKTFETAAGLELTDEMRAHIAVQACLLILNLGLDYYAGWQSVILYPGDFRVPKEEIDEIGVVHRWQEDLSGEAWQQGPVILSWQATANPSMPQSNIVLHEFAHKLDMRDGRADGCPPLPTGMSEKTWAIAFSKAYASFCAQLDTGQATLIDDYAGESPAEFFAVLSEVFFADPELLKASFTDVYQQLQTFYRQDPAVVLRSQ